MSIVVAKDLAKYYGAQDIFAGISFQIAHGDRIALVGANGVGKTTLLRIIAGLETPTSGQVDTAKNLRMGYLSQRADLATQRTLYDEMLQAFEHLRAQQDQLRRLEGQMADPEQRAQAMQRYGELLQAFELAGGYTYELEIKRVLSGLGFAEEDHAKPLQLLSGGQRTRAQLAKLLLQKPGLLLLDEPTNHLDLQATEWLEEFLGQWKGSLIVVAHDRYFLDKVVNRVWEMGFGHMDQYRGNYSGYAEARKLSIAHRQAEYAAQQELIAKEQDFIRRYKAGQRSREARGREKRLQHLERVGRPQRQKTMSFSLSTKARGGNNVLVTRGLQVGYDRPLIECPNLLLLRRERAALLGPNGCGKTTLLKTLLGEIPALAGEFKIGANVQVAYFAQGHEDLNEENTVLDEILGVKNLPLEQARGLLGRFLFSGDDVFKSVASLSGGERGRVALATLTLHGANFLLLDEPTNHLDIPSQELLEQVLQDFPGTILFVSHDRYFIDALATQVWLIQDCRLRVYEGNYSDYMAQAKQEASPAPATRPAPRPREAQRETRGDGPALRQAEERRAELEAEIEGLEERLSVLSRELELASRGQQVNRLYDLGQEYAQVEQQLQQCLEEWSGASEACPSRTSSA